MKNFYKGGNRLLLSKSFYHRVTSKNNRSRTLFSLILSFTFLLFSNPAIAQEPREDGGADGQLGIKPLTVGDSVPDAFWQHQLQSMNTGNEDQITLERYRNKELIILDFWGVFCVPCIYAIDTLHTLAGKYGDKVQIITVTFESKEEVKEMVNRREWTLPGIVNDSVLRGYFPHRIVPHQVWIKDGKVRVIGSGNETNQINIDKILADDRLNIKIKRDRLNIDKQAPLLKYKDYTSEISQSTFSKYIDGNGTYKSTANVDGLNILSFSNMSPLFLYRVALQIPSLSHIKLVEINGWNSREDSVSTAYQLITSIQKKSRIDSLVKKNLDDHFEVSSQYELCREKVWVIKRIDPVAADLDSKSLPITMIDFVTSLNNSSANKTKTLFISAVDPKLKVSRELLKIFRKGDFDNFQKAMGEFGLKAFLEKRDVEKFVIRKKNSKR